MQVVDVWNSLRLSFKNLFLATIALYLLLLYFNYIQFFQVGFFLICVQSILIYLRNSKYIIDFDRSTFTFPRTDIENSILEILIGSRYWNLMRTKTIQLSDIDNIYIDTKRWSTSYRKRVGNYKSGAAKYRTSKKRHIRYTINITGSFGGANLSFLGRQKRDEVRSMLQGSVKDVTGRNIDRKIAEFS